MRAFVTGSQTYGYPRADSDLDLVVVVSPEDLKIIQVFANARATVLGSGSPDNVSVRFGPLNLIALSDQRDYELWRDGTEDLKDRKPVTHTQAVSTFEAMKKDRDTYQPGLSDMGVEVSLLKMVKVPGSRPLWPTDFAEKVAMLEDNRGANLNDKAQWGVIADWLDENGEPELADAFRWVFKRSNLKVVQRGGNYGIDDLPPAVSVRYSVYNFDVQTIPGFAAALSAALVKAREDAA